MPGKEQAVWKGIGNAVADLAQAVGPGVVVHKSETSEACTAGEQVEEGGTPAAAAKGVVSFLSQLTRRE